MDRSRPVKLDRVFPGLGGRSLSAGAAVLPAVVRVFAASRSPIMSHVRSTVTVVLVLAGLAFFAGRSRADTASLEAEVRKRAAAVQEKLITWRRDIHQHPEL